MESSESSKGENAEALHVPDEVTASAKRKPIQHNVSLGRKNKPGRPRKDVDVERARQLRAEGLSYGQISKILKIPKGTLYSRLKSSWKSS